jgi:hypothetical protein
MLQSGCRKALFGQNPLKNSVLYQFWADKPGEKGPKTHATRLHIRPSLDQGNLSELPESSTTHLNH